MALIEAKNLHKTYRLGRQNTVQALREAHVSIEASEMVAIMGPSGCGKSTLMHILGLLHHPDSDSDPRPTLSLDNVDVTALSDRERTRIRAEKMGFVFQAFNLVPTLSASENVALAAEYAGAPRKKAGAAALEALGWVNLSGRAGHRPTELSGGEQQRVALARALINRPSLLLADEPTGNLDSASSAEVLHLLRSFNRDRGQTIILVTHDEEVAAACSRVLRMKDGLVTT